jgi:hypothetical protein
MKIENGKISYLSQWENNGMETYRNDETISIYRER